MKMHNKLARWRRAVPVLAVSVLLGTAGAATATPAAAPTIRSEATTEPFVHENVAVELVRVNDPHGEVCVTARKVTTLSDTEREVARQAGCAETPNSYRADPVPGKAHLKVTISAPKTALVEQFDGSHWQTVSFTSAPAEATIDVSWQATGTAVEPRIIGPSWCYGGTIICYTQVQVRRDAVVAGRLHFPALHMSVPVPSQHPGTLTFG